MPVLVCSRPTSLPLHPTPPPPMLGVLDSCLSPDTAITCILQYACGPCHALCWVDLV